ncbi:RDD family protein [Actinomadura sp. 9N215]|uniref:RDD family protein n=1 Tax=Actinomadura sp. 9N215 TaxID=3375150 RepID=UPI003789DBD7
MREAPLAEPGQRLLARIVDTLIVGVPVIVVVRALVSGPTVDVVAPPAFAGCMLLYEAIQLTLWSRTIGKRVAGIEVVVVAPNAPLAPGETAAKARRGKTEALTSESAPESQETDAESSRQGQEDESGPTPDAATDLVPINERPRLDVVRAVARAAVYSLPIAARPIPVAGLLAGIFWLANAGALYEGTRRQAVHDRLTGTLVVKRLSR